jgi:hypothetical protein
VHKIEYWVYPAVMSIAWWKVAVILTPPVAHFTRKAATEIKTFSIAGNTLRWAFNEWRSNISWAVL